MTAEYCQASLHKAIKKSEYITTNQNAHACHYIVKVEHATQMVCSSSSLPQQVFSGFLTDVGDILCLIHTNVNTGVLPACPPFKLHIRSNVTWNESSQHVWLVNQERYLTEILKCRGKNEHPYLLKAICRLRYVNGQTDAKKQSRPLSKRPTSKSKSIVFFCYHLLTVDSNTAETTTQEISNNLLTTTR